MTISDVSPKVIQVVSVSGEPGWPLPACTRQVAVESCPREILAAFGSSRVVLAVPPSMGQAWIKELARRKRYFALSEWHGESQADLLQMASFWARRRPAPVLLGTWRFLPPVLGIRELLVAGILGQVTQVELRLPAAIIPQKQLLANDLLAFLGLESLPTQGIETLADVLAITVNGTGGAAVASGRLDGTQAHLQIQQGTVERQRDLPDGNPRMLEEMMFAEAEKNNSCLLKIKEVAHKIPCVSVCFEKDFSSKLLIGNMFNN